MRTGCPHTRAPVQPDTPHPLSLQPSAYSLRLRTTAVLAVVFLSCLIASNARAADYAWLEGEAPTSINVDPVLVNLHGWGNAQYLSGGNWLSMQIPADQADAKTPPGGALLSYDFQAPSAGRYEVWNRIGFEFVRSDFDWRIDDGPWSTIKSTEFTMDLMEISFWCEVAWIKMGESDLTTGKHTLQIRCQVPYKEDNGVKKPQRIFYTSDALCIYKGDFRPNSKFKPDEDWQNDADRAAAAQVFQAPAAPRGPQTSVSLKGNWQIARWDETAVEGRVDPIKETPAPDTLFWKAAAVPGNTLKTCPEFSFAHRYFLRTRVQVPDQLAGRSFFLHFPAVNMIASVFVNGQQCGWTKAPFAVWDCDVTRAIKPGATNEIWVGIKDTYYAMEPPEGENLRQLFNLPRTFFNSNQGVSMKLDFPVWNHDENGILQEPSLVIAGKLYASDVFAIPSVKNRTLGLQVTVQNPTGHDSDVTVRNYAAPMDGGPVEKAFAPATLQVPAGQSALLKIAEPWANPKLWWPDDPREYVVVTQIVIDGQVVDERRTPFGFREWDWHGSHFTLNGVPWYGRADTSSWGSTPEQDLAGLKQHGQNMIRLWGEDGWHGLSTEQALDFFDSHGMPIRRTGIFDGEGANYGLVEEVDQGGKEVRVARRALFDNWFNQLSAWVRAQRNHPCIFIWSMENEITFINSRVFGLNATTDPEMKRAADLVAAIDPTRPQMTDGGNALLDESLPVYGAHYIEGKLTEYPDWGYTLPDSAHKQQWPITQNRPIFFGETYYANGIPLSSLAAVGGDPAFVGKAEARPAIGLMAKMMSEGYRWSGLAAFHFWEGNQSSVYYNSWQPRAVLCRQWDFTFGSGQKVTRTLGIFNDTHYADPITLTWAVTLGGKKVADETGIHHLAPGGQEKFGVSFTMPAVTAREEGEMHLSLVVAGRPVFNDVKPLSVLPPPVLESAVSSAGVRPDSTGPATRLSARTLLVYDPSGVVGTFLKGRGIPFTTLAGLSALTPDGKVLVLGRNALTPAQSASSALAAWASAGRAVIVLEQQYPLHYQAVPADLTPAANEGRVAFVEDLDHPVFKGLAQRDFLTWGPGAVIYRNAYQKPTRGASSLVQCDDGLQDTALVEVPAGQGVLLLSQFLIGEKLANNAVAQQLLVNLLDYGARYRPVFRPASVVAADNPRLVRALDAIGLQYTVTPDPLQAIAAPGSAAVISATAGNLKILADNLPKVQQFTNGGGWIVLNGLTPEGLEDYNKIVGFDHMMRRFGREKVQFSSVRNPLTAGLSQSDIVMSSGKRIFNWAAGDYPAEDEFSYVVDLSDVAPFGKSPFYAYGNTTNNFVSADGWPLIINFPAPKEGVYEIPITLPKPETITSFTWVGNTFYWPTTRVSLVFNGTDRVPFETEPTNDPQTFEINPPRTAQNLTLRIEKWTPIPDKAPNVGIDNIYLMAKRPADFAKRGAPHAEHRRHGGISPRSGRDCFVQRGAQRHGHRAGKRRKAQEHSGSHSQESPCPVHRRRERDRRRQSHLYPDRTQQAGQPAPGTTGLVRGQSLVLPGPALREAHIRRRALQRL